MDSKMHTLKEEPMAMDAPMRMLPSFSLTEKDLPEIKEWKVGKKYKVELEVEMVAVSKNEYGESDTHARFKIHKIGTKNMMSDEEMKGRKGHY